MEIMLGVRLLFRLDRLGRAAVVVAVFGVGAGLFPFVNRSAVSSRVFACAFVSVPTTVPVARAAAVLQFPSLKRHPRRFHERIAMTSSKTATTTMGTCSYEAIRVICNQYITPLAIAAA